MRASFLLTVIALPLAAASIQTSKPEDVGLSSERLWRLAIWCQTMTERRSPQRFRWTFPRYFCKVSMRACDKQVTHHASDDQRWPDVLWPGVEAGGTRSDPADHAGVFHSESDRAGAHGL